MIFVSRARRRALHAPILLVGAQLGCSALTGLLLRREGLSLPTVMVGVTAFVVSFWATFTFRVVWREGDTLLVRGFGGKETFDARRAAFGIAATYGTRSGPTYTVYVTEGDRRQDIGEYHSRRVLPVHQALSECLLELDDGRGAHARKRTEREIERWMAQEDAARATVDAYYQSPAWKRLPILIGVGLALYLLGMGAFIHFGQR